MGRGLIRKSARSAHAVAVETPPSPTNDLPTKQIAGATDGVAPPDVARFIDRGKLDERFVGKVDQLIHRDLTLAPVRLTRSRVF